MRDGKCAVRAAKRDDELESLRELVRTAAYIFEATGATSVMSPQDILRETLLCAQADFSVIGDASHAGGGVDSMVFRRAELRIDLGIALAEYCNQFGWPKKSADDDASEVLNGGAS